MSELSLSTQYKMQKLDIDGISVTGLFLSLEIFENIYSPTLHGSISLIESDTSNFLDKHNIEGIESISFQFTNANDEQLFFSGYLNGIRNKVIMNQKITYVFDFHSISLLKNECEFVTEKFTNLKPEDIVEKMIDRVEGSWDRKIGTGLPMTFIGNRRRPFDIIKYVLKNGVNNNRAYISDSDKEKTSTASGIGGFLLWETIEGYRFAGLDNVQSGQSGNEFDSFESRLQNNNLSIQTSMQTILSYDFKVLGDFQNKLRAGAFNNASIIFDLDKGLYKKIVYKDDSNMTEKQKENSCDHPTRYLFAFTSNERFESTCEKAPENYWDKTKLNLSQNTAGHNTLIDQVGTFILPPRFTMKAGDVIKVKLPKVDSGSGGGYDRKHSGRYIISQVGHHIFSSGEAYTKVKTIRSSIQKDDASSSNTSEKK